MDTRPLAIELFAGTGSATAPWCELGGRAVCFDLEYLLHHGKPHERQERVIQDVLTLHGSQFKDAAFIWGSPPCQNYSYLAMPWSRSKDPENSKAAKALRKKWETEEPDNRLFDACFRIQREAIEATQKTCEACDGSGSEADDPEDGTPGYTCSDCGGLGWTERRYIPMIVENVRGAVPWVGREAAKFGSFYMWGDVAQIGNRVIAGRDLGDIRAGRGRFGMGVAPEKVPGFRFDGSGRSFQTASVEARGVKVPGQIQGKEYAMCRTGAAGQKTLGHVNKRDGHGHTRHLTNQAESDAVRAAATKVGGDWFRDPACHSKHGSKSNARKAASALIARIPEPLARYIAEQHLPLAQGAGLRAAAGKD